jgi:hypothetical protein
MGISYTTPQREIVKRDKTRKLATIAITGEFSFQGPMTQPELEVLRKALVEVAKIRKEGAT